MWKTTKIKGTLEDIQKEYIVELFKSHLYEDSNLEGSIQLSYFNAWNKHTKTMRD